MTYDQHCTTAAAFARAGRLEEWVHAYLLSDGNNKAFSDGLRLFPRHYIGPINMPLRMLTRCCGPEEHMKFRIDRDGFESRVTGIADAIRAGADLPPLIIHYANGGFELSDGNHRHEACMRLGLAEFPVIVWITENAELADFREKYAAYLSEID